MELGTVISTNDSPNTSKYYFVINGGEVHKGQFVQAQTQDGTTIGLVTDLVKTNKYFERADTVKNYEASGLNINEQFPTEEWEYLVAEVRPLGSYKDKKLTRVSKPLSPGSKINTVQTELLKTFLGLDEKGLTIGDLEYHDVTVKLNMSKLLQKHLAILAISGAGKSVTGTVLMEELLERTREQGRVATIVLDVHGEYTSLAQPPKDQNCKDYSRQVKIIKAQDMKIGLPNLSAELLNSLVPGLSSTAKREVQKTLQKLKAEQKEGHGPFGLSKLEHALLKEDMKENVRAPILSWLGNLRSLGVFSANDQPAVKQVAQPGQLTIIDFSNIIDVRKKQVLVAYLARKLFNERRAKHLPPFLLVLEEAHQFVPESSKKEVAVARGIMETIAREGRKFGASLCLISQRPIQLSTTVLSQCNTHIIMRVTNPYDLDHIGKSSEGIDKRSLDMITSLRVGEALIVGEAVNYPTFFKVRWRKSEPSQHERTLEEASQDFENTEDSLRDDAKNYL